jgi:CrcB protein
MTWIWILFGGALGAGGRHAVSILSEQWMGRHFPIGTLFVNVVGSFAIGFIYFLTETGGKWPLHQDIRYFLMGGVLGGFTTFSAFSLQTLQLLDGGQWGRAIANIGLNLSLCLLACATGIALARGLPFLQNT